MTDWIIIRNNFHQIRFSVVSLCRVIKDINLYNEEKPYTYITQDPDIGFDAEFTNLQTQWVENVVIHDIRNYNTELSIDVDRFKYFTHDTLLGTRFDEDGFNEDIREMITVIERQLQAEKAIKFDFRVCIKKYFTLIATDAN